MVTKGAPMASPSGTHSSWPTRAERRARKDVAVARLVETAKRALCRAEVAETRCIELELALLESGHVASFDKRVEAEVVDRLNCIRPMLQDLVSAAASGSEVQDEHLQRLRRNVALHAMFGSGLVISDLNAAQLRLAQKGTLPTVQTAELDTVMAKALEVSALARCQTGTGPIDGGHPMAVDWHSCLIPASIRRPWDVFAEDLEDKVEDVIGRSGIVDAVTSARLSAVKECGAQEVFFDLPVCDQHNFSDVSLMELSAFVQWQRTQPTYVSRMLLEKAWADLHVDDKWAWVTDDPRAALSGDAEWAALLT